MINNKRCLNCNSNNFNTLFSYENFNVVSSDNKLLKCNFILLECNNCHLIQKQVNDDILSIINTIYEEYTSYYLTEGKEEFLQINNSISSRSKEIIKNISSIINSKGVLLDIGAGKGVFLEEFSKIFGWELYAQDLKNNLNDSLQRNNLFKKLYLIDLDMIENDKFDLISAIHVFEHIIKLDSFLKNIKNILKPNGILLLQVPYINKNLFDIFIIDHINHFNQMSLHNILKKYFKYVSFPNSQIDKEITILASDKEFSNIIFAPLKNDLIDYKYYIGNMVSELSNLNENIAIFGTTPPALFCAKYINMNILCFVDEDPSKQTKKFYNKNIVLPQLLPNETKVLMPYSNHLLKKMKKKYPHLNFIKVGSFI